MSAGHSLWTCTADRPNYEMEKQVRVRLGLFQHRGFFWHEHTHTHTHTQTPNSGLLPKQTSHCFSVVQLDVLILHGRCSHWGLLVVLEHFKAFDILIPWAFWVQELKWTDLLLRTLSKQLHQAFLLQIDLRILKCIYKMLPTIPSNDQPNTLLMQLV